MRVLASCCDNDSGLFLWENGEFKHLMLGHGQAVFRCRWGIAWMAEGFFRILDEKLDIVHEMKFNLQGHHGADYDPVTGRFVVVSSDKNSISFVNVFSGVIEDEWEINPHGSHTNDIFATEKGFYTSSFHQGIVFTGRDKSRSVIFPHQNKPHTVKLYNGELWWCESESRNVKCEGEILIEHPGFVRGLDWDDDGNIIVGVSRHKYRNEGSAGFYYKDKFYGIPPVGGKNEVSNLYSILII